jgi:hypothetical protein
MSRFLPKAMLMVALSAGGTGLAVAGATERDAVEACTASLIEGIGELQGTPPAYEIAGRHGTEEDFTGKLFRSSAGVRNYRYTLEVTAKAGGPVLWTGDCVVDSRARVRWLRITAATAD